MEWMIMPYKRYADFTGRSQRQEYWMFQLFLLIVYVVLFLLTGALGSGGDPSDPGALSTIGWMVLMVFWLGTIVPAIAVTVRRLHDQDKSGWMILISLVPLVGGFILLFFMVQDGTPGPNQYGPDPKGRNDIGFGGEPVERPKGVNIR